MKPDQDLGEQPPKQEPGSATVAPPQPPSQGQTMSEGSASKLAPEAGAIGRSGIEGLMHGRGARRASTSASRPQTHITERHKSKSETSEGFSRDQLRKLVRHVDAKHVQTREFEGKRLTYIEGWYAIAQANAIFGHAGWDREMVHFERVMEKVKTDSIVICGYMARVRIRVRAGSTEVIREGTGWGSASASTATAANERALKAAETDATKRALSTFGASFGLSLYDKDHVPAKPRPVFTLFAPDGKLLDGALSPEAYCTGLRQLIEACKDTHQVDQLSRHNRTSLTELRIQVPSLRNAQGVHFADLLLRLMQKRRARLMEAGTANGSADGSLKEGSEGGPVNPTPASAALTGAQVRATGAEAIHVNGSSSQGAPSAWTNSRNGAHSAMGSGAAFRRITGQSARRRAPYPFPSGAEACHEQVVLPNDTMTPTIEVVAAEEKKSALVEASPLAVLTARPAEAGYTATLEKLAPRGGNEATPPSESMRAPEPVPAASKIAFGPKVDKSRLFLGVERRIRDKAHLRRVAELPCLICNRQPSHAHHLRFAQRRGMSQKVSDEYVVPLCALHHGDLHRSSSEQDWWAKQRIDPLPISSELWLRHHRQQGL